MSNNKIIIGSDDELKGKKEKEANSKWTESVKKIADFDFNISFTDLSKQMPFVLYICLLIMLFIYNSHHAEKLIRETDKLNREVKELRSEYISVLSELMSESKQSAIAKKLEATGIKELKNPPKKITVNGN